jgi:hypothetical protein
MATLSVYVATLDLSPREEPRSASATCHGNLRAIHELCGWCLGWRAVRVGAAANEVPGGAWIVALAIVRPSPSPSE